MHRSTFPHFCIEQEFAPDDVEALRHIAIAKNPANNVFDDPLDASFEAGADVGLLWESGEIISVSFMNGDPITQNKVTTWAREWSKHANITFNFVHDLNATIRISFAETGTWSAVGLQALFKDKNRPTMNFDRLYPDSPDTDYSHFVLHEFGHALGLKHEHQSPYGGIQWNRQAVINDLLPYWNLPKIEKNIFKRFEDTDTETQFTFFDPKSIMIYEIPLHWTLNGVTYSRNNTLSQTDKDFIRACYP